jgi:hypothetical protein
LRRRELVVEDDDRRILRGDHHAELVDLALADVRRGVWAVELLRQRPDDDGARGVGEPLELIEVLGDVVARGRPLDGSADEERALLRRLEVDEGLDDRCRVSGMGRQGRR